MKRPSAASDQEERPLEELPSDASIGKGRSLCQGTVLQKEWHESGGYEVSFLLSSGGFCVLIHNRLMIFIG